MITNDVQYRSTKALHARFLEAADNLAAQLATAQNKKLHQLQIDSARAQASDLAREVDEYEQLQSGATTTFTADSLSDLPLLLIRARVARGWSQRQLATELGIAEQQIQRYEANSYATASLTRLCEVANALGLHIRETAALLSRTPAA
jgi:HTH-type transcriptional regulator / antitoxin HigA